MRPTPRCTRSSARAHHLVLTNHAWNPQTRTRPAQPLLRAAGSGSAACCRLLLEAGAGPESASDLLLAYDEVLRSVSEGVCEA